MGRKSVSRKIELAGPDPAIFDVSQLRRYTIYQNDLELELVDLFRQQLPQFLKQLRLSETSYDWKLATHSLKGSAQTIGAPVLAAIAEKLEIAGHDGNRKERQKLIDALDVAIADFNAAIQHYYH